ncbi:MAG: hypothetical protein LBV17_08395 [Treponema sp.]|jgi:hypothetical protein|nr:hypothetical protein [Treponema sp.]
MKEKIQLFIVLVVFLAVLSPFFSCGSSSKQQNTDNEEWSYVQGGTTFKVTKEQYDSTKEDVQHFIEKLNQTIRKKDYKAWKAALSTEYFNKISSPENLQQVSELPAMKTRRITLKTAEDYFINVVVPSRANSRVDDIEFIGENRVKAFTVTTNKAGEEQRLRLYDLEKTGNMWKIID